MDRAKAFKLIRSAEFSDWESVGDNPMSFRVRALNFAPVIRVEKLGNPDGSLRRTQLTDRIVTRHFDPAGYRIECRLWIDKSPDVAFVLLELDAGRATIPAPDPDTNVVLRDAYYDLARAFCKRSTVHDYINRSGLILAPL